MAHAPTRDALNQLASETADEPTGFLEGLSPIHDDWHSTITRTYGFLLFHYRVVRHFKAIVNPRLQQAVVPYTLADLQGMNVPLPNVDPNTATSLTGLATFSATFESWHNGAHGRIGAATGVPMMDARQNVFFRPFWRLHLYIDGLFQAALDRYGQSAHANQFLDTAAVAGHIEASHHSWVPRI